jgi:predicted O-methyltransferase YrrM
MISDCAFDLDPGTMRRSGDAAAFFRDLYETYNDELAALTAAMADMHRSMLANGYRADFSDRESELLYLLIRHFRPDTVVEMSPCHGYSTNYILAALTANQRGHVHSYEITTAVQGRPIEEVIRGNLLPSFDAGRMSLHIGDALKTVIPSCDLAFIDSNHEAWFAASYLQHVVPRARLCLTHDIVVRHRSGLIPKAAFTGVREAAQVLQSLAENGQRCIAVAGLDLPGGFTSRQSAPERSLIYAGHPTSRSPAMIMWAISATRSMRRGTSFSGAAHSPRSVSACCSLLLVIASRKSAPTSRKHTRRCSRRCTPNPLLFRPTMPPWTWAVVFARLLWWPLRTAGQKRLQSQKRLSRRCSPGIGPKAIRCRSGSRGSPSASPHDLPHADEAVCNTAQGARARDAIELCNVS